MGYALDRDRPDDPRQRAGRGAQRRRYLERVNDTTNGAIVPCSTPSCSQPGTRTTTSRHGHDRGSHPGDPARRRASLHGHVVRAGQRGAGHRRARRSGGDGGARAAILRVAPRPRDAGPPGAPPDLPRRTPGMVAGWLGSLVSTARRRTSWITAPFLAGGDRELGVAPTLRDPLRRSRRAPRHRERWSVGARPSSARGRAGLGLPPVNEPVRRPGVAATAARARRDRRGGCSACRRRRLARHRCPEGSGRAGTPTSSSASSLRTAGPTAQALT